MLAKKLIESLDAGATHASKREFSRGTSNTATDGGMPTNSPYADGKRVSKPRQDELRRFWMRGEKPPGMLTADEEQFLASL